MKHESICGDRGQCWLAFGGLSQSTSYYFYSPLAGFNFLDCSTMVSDTIKMSVGGVVCALLASSAHAFSFKSISYYNWSGVVPRTLLVVSLLQLIGVPHVQAPCAHHSHPSNAFLHRARVGFSPVVDLNLNSTNPETGATEL